jgi:hypothetical protein
MLPLAVDRDPDGRREARRCPASIDEPQTPVEACQRGHHTGWRNLPDRVADGVGDVHDARTVHRHAFGTIEPFTRGPVEASRDVVPASLVVTPAAVTLRILLLLVSATYTVPAPSTATPRGLLNRAALPVPSVLSGRACQARQRRHAASRDCDFPDRCDCWYRHIQDTRGVYGNRPEVD